MVAPPPPPPPLLKKILLDPSLFKFLDRPLLCRFYSEDVLCSSSAILTCRLCQNTFCYAGAIAFSDARFGGGFGRRIFLDEVGCSGFESMLTQCPANPIGNHNCVHEEDAGVQCARTGMIAPSPSPSPQVYNYFDNRD